jgi:hypothetical protein
MLTEALERLTTVRDELRRLDAWVCPQIAVTR